MKYIYFILFIFIFNLSKAQSNHLIVKWSEKDCTYCSISLTQLTEYAKTNRLKIIAKENLFDTTQLKLLQNKGFQIQFSDSLFYSLDSLERSFVYVIYDNKLIDKYLLKEFNVNKVDFLSKTTKSKHEKIFKKIECLVADENYLYVYSFGYIYKLSMQNIEMVLDSIEIVSSPLRETIFNSIYGNDYLKHIQTFDSIYTSFSIPSKIEFKDFSIKRNKLYSYISVPWINNEDTSKIELFKKTFIVKYNNGKLDSIFEFKKPLFDEYYVGSSFFNINSRDDLFFSVKSKKFPEKSNLLAKARFDGTTIVVDEITNVKLPQNFVDNKIGYKISSMVKSKTFFAHAFSNQIYSIEKGIIHTFDLPYQENQFYLKDLDMGMPQIKYKIISMWEDQKFLYILFIHLEYYKVLKCDKFQLETNEEILKFNINITDCLPVYSNNLGVFFIDKLEKKLTFKSFEEIRQ